MLDLISEYQQYEEASGDDDAEYEENPRLTLRTAPTESGMTEQSDVSQSTTEIPA